MPENEIKGHPAIEVPVGNNGHTTLITVCGNCEEMRTILFLTKDRWFCWKCKMEGVAPPQMFPIA